MSIVIEHGTAWALFVYDVGVGIDLDEAERRVAAGGHRESIKHKRRAPEYFAYRPAPLRVTVEAPGLMLGARAMLPRVDCVAYDFGAVCVTYGVPISGPLEDLGALADELYENPVLMADSRERVAALSARLGPAVRRAKTAPLVEDYVIYQVQRLVGGADNLEERIDAAAQAIAQVLRAERQTLSPDEVHDTLSRRISFTTTDAAIIDWNAAMLFQADAEDVLAVLEFANVELLEMRHLDDRLDGMLDRSYEKFIGGTMRERWPLLGSSGKVRREIAAMHMEAALLFEGVNNALKLVGDQYLARVYRLAAERLHLPEWDASVLRKIETLEGLYEKINDEQATRRLEILEWIVIILIAIDVVLPFISPKH